MGGPSGPRTSAADCRSCGLRSPRSRDIAAHVHRRATLAHIVGMARVLSRAERKVEGKAEGEGEKV